MAQVLVYDKVDASVRFISHICSQYDVAGIVESDVSKACEELARSDVKIVFLMLLYRILHVSVILCMLLLVSTLDAFYEIYKNKIL